MPTVREALTFGSQQLAQTGCDTPRLDAELLLAHILNRSRTWLYTYPATRLEKSQLNRFQRLLERRAGREPVAYITGSKPFFGLDFAVTPASLIPRPETELLIETALARPAPPSTVADIGTGSGCIAVALARHWPRTRLLAVDICPKALTVARQNAIRHGVADRITFVRGDLLAPLSQPLDLIVSNPPYISRTELAELAPEVARYEPRLALDGGTDGLALIRLLLAQARTRLGPAGSLLVELGAAQGEAVYRLARQTFPEADCQIKQDLAGRDRLLAVNR